MSIAPAPGIRLGPYELVSPLGAGGMGEVWKGRDTRLGRDVAIKILPAAFAQSEQFLARFEREAKTISSLNHPNICTLFDVGHEDDTHFLVMELIEGESLADRIGKGPMALDQVLRFGSQIADALDRAHKQGIVHRDLKPGNVMLTKTGAKLLDFGLARPAAESAVVQGMTELPTQAKPLTQEGTILGTFQYMAPEQLEGQESDARTDIFALGTVLYEMATGRRAFEGSSRTSLIASIVSSQPPPIATIAPMAPPALEHVVKKCLEKDPNDRWQSAHDVASELRWISEAGSQAGVAATVTIRRRSRERLAWVVAAVAVVAALAVGVTHVATPDQPPALIVSSIDIPPEMKTSLFSAFAISPDGTTVAFVLQDQEGTTSIWLRPLDSATFRRLDGTEGASHPFWSPDSRRIGFFTVGKLNTISAQGGPVTAVCSITAPRGAAWGSNGQILFSPTAIGPLMTVPEGGGTPTAITRLREEETSHRWPVILPGGKNFLFLSTGNTNNICQASFERPDEIRTVIESYSSFAWSPPGHLLYARGTLLAHRYDPKRATVLGDATPIADRIAFTDNLRALFSVADDGTLVLQRGEGIAFQYTTLTWVDRAGKVEETITEPALFFSPSLSRDGRRLAVDLSSTTSGFGDIWLFDLERDVRSRLTFEEPNESSPLWSPDDRRVVYFGALWGGGNIYEVSSGGTGGAELLVEGEGERRPTDYSRDGEWIVYNQSGGTDSGSYDIGVWSASEKKAHQWLATPFNEYCAQLSPDTKWIAYQSDESGRMEIYVQAFPESDRKWMISSGGGRMPVWRGDGREIFYVSLDGKMTAVPVTPGTELGSGAPVALFDAPIRVHQARQYDVTPDGRRFLLNRIVESETPEPLMLIQNWSAKLSEE